MTQLFWISAAGEEQNEIMPDLLAIYDFLQFDVRQRTNNEEWAAELLAVESALIEEYFKIHSLPAGLVDSLKRID
ncbi:hypothetical protein GCM10010978_09970 [Compostibacillus humi]|uniref:Uncharacterized protein n=1 Tax=Compostibacillus humi TaxID=1245525 RepID=A0A8J2ZRY2_9BACI|nr:hypothetical protein [Compostibacillus humi]GGH72766.1 hypothetical protein GCM10010978_09970 [Compostibacillus humi]